jgi:hypothetical protein
MLSLYYRIWVDCIKKGKSRPGNRNWVSMSMVLMSIAMTLNFVLVMVILQRLISKNYFYKISLPALPKYFSNVVSFIVLFVLPIVIINYFLIFNNERYKKLIEKYPDSDGKLFSTYFSISLLTPIILLWIGMIYFR